ncbi:MAG: serine hydrolase domain-containing protein, partial [Pseudomonadota bacterium]
SVTKSIVSMLVGAAIKDGFIESVDEPVTDYLPRLKGSAYDRVTIGNILQMSSGVQWNEDYSDPGSDIARADLSTLGTYRQLRRKQVVAQSGEKFNYNTAETNLVGTLLRSAVGNNLSTYLSEKIWRPFGMRADANWMLSEPGGGESGGCCISATLRDYGRIGLFALAGGRLADGTKTLPSGWMKRSVTPSRGNDEYGYLWWLHGNGSFRAQGIFGQDIFMDPRRRIVIALQSARADADKPDDWKLQDAFYQALIQTLDK